MSFVDPFESAGFVEGFSTTPAPPNDPETSVEIYFRHWKPATSLSRPVLLLHGHPQTHVIWSSVAPTLASTGKWEVVVPDNRGNGKSKAPTPKADAKYSRYSKREMARDMVNVMKSLGHDKFYVAAHDRGARIAHRMALDHPDKVIKLILLDIAPTLDMYNKTDQRFAKYYWHWFFLLQPSLPETFLHSNPEAYLQALVTRFPTTSSPGSTAPSSTANAGEAKVQEWRMASYLSNLQKLENVTAMCEDYRASGPGAVDLSLDQQDREQGKRIQCPTKVFWGKKGVIQLMYNGGLDLWQACCQHQVQGEGLETGHYIPEEAPERVCEEIEKFFD